MFCILSIETARGKNGLIIIKKSFTTAAHRRHRAARAANKEKFYWSRCTEGTEMFTELTCLQQAGREENLFNAKSKRLKDYH